MSAPLEVPRKPDLELRIRVAKKVLEEAGYTILAPGYTNAILAPGVRVLQKTAQASCPIDYYNHRTGFAAIIKDNLRRQLTSAAEKFVVIRSQEDIERALIHLQGLLTIVVEPTDG